MEKKLKCVLLIDDDEPTNYYNSLIIEETGCADHVEVAQGGQKALEYLTNSQYRGKGNCFSSPDLIFLDINMPAMDGWEFLDKYRSLKKEHKDKTVLIMLTTSLFSEDILKATAIPEISGFESKPLTPEIIDKILEKYFGDPHTKKEDKMNPWRL